MAEDVEVNIQKEKHNHSHHVTTDHPPSLAEYEAHPGIKWIPHWDAVGAGLSADEADKRLKEYGPNCLPEKHVNPIIKYLKNYWGPMPIMIWAAIFLILAKSLVAKTTGEGSTSWPDFIMCCVLQFVNGNVKWYNGRNAENAIKALKDKMAPQAIVRRDGEWMTIQAKLLVPGDVVQVRIGDICAADGRLGCGENLQLDQAALTGESLPRNKKKRDILYAGTVVKRGDGEYVVVSTGRFTEMGRAANMVASVKTKSRYDFILFWVAMYLLTLSLTLMTIQFVKMSWIDCRPDEIKPCNVLASLSVVVLILVGALPVAMHVVCMVIMAMGAFRLSEHKAVVSELTATEELSGMTVLCTDKTGTLTQNKLHIILDKTVTFAGCSQEDLMFYAGISCRRLEEGQDAIDHCITQTCKKWNDNDELFHRMNKHPTVDFVPFDPEIKRTEATISGPDGQIFCVAKGAPQIMLNLSQNCDEIKEKCLQDINDLATAGYRTIGIARGTADKKWTFVGLLAIADPPRFDTKEVVEKAQALGIKVLMITGDQLAIAKEVGSQVGIGDNMIPAHVLKDADNAGDYADEEMAELLPEICARVDGFAEVMPEDKFRVVQLLQRNGHIVGMTGDGVNDAPALKRANVGIAVEGSTDAARAASAIFLQKHGLGCIITAIMRSKKVFERVKNYIIYRSATSLRLMGFFFTCTMAIPPLMYMPDALDANDEYRAYREACEDLDVFFDDSGGVSIFRGLPVYGLSPYATCLRMPPALYQTMAEVNYDWTFSVDKANDYYETTFGKKLTKPSASSKCWGPRDPTTGGPFWKGGQDLVVKAIAISDSDSKPDDTTKYLEALVQDQEQIWAEWEAEFTVEEKVAWGLAQEIITDPDTDEQSAMPWSDDSGEAFERQPSGPRVTGFGTYHWYQNCASEEFIVTDNSPEDLVPQWFRWESTSMDARTLAITNEKSTIPQDWWESMYRFVHTDLNIGTAFKTPTMVVIVLTVLNDFTVITIAFDHVQISNAPDTWWLWRNIAIGTVIGANTLGWSLIMFLFMLGTLDPTSYQCQDFGLCLQYPQVLTGAFLQLSLCARLARTNARTDDWFWVLRLTRSVISTMSFSIVAAIFFGFAWPFCSGEDSCDPKMMPAAPLMCAIIILYQIPVHIIRDICKLMAYAVFRRIDREAEDRHKKEVEYMDKRCFEIMAKKGYVMTKHEAKVFTNEEKIALGLINEDDIGPCLPYLCKRTGPPLIAINEWKKNCGCNPLGFFGLFLVVAGVTIVLVATGN